MTTQRLQNIVRIFGTWGPGKVGLWVGSPLGPSVSNLGTTSAYDGLSNATGFDPGFGNVGQSIDNYLNSPSVEQVQSPTTNNPSQTQTP